VPSRKMQWEDKPQVVKKELIHYGVSDNQTATRRLIDNEGGRIFSRSRLLTLLSPLSRETESLEAVPGSEAGFRVDSLSPSLRSLASGSVA
jgi:hypothetical protein